MLSRAESTDTSTKI